MQGSATVPEVTSALAELDADPSVDVIVVARGGGSAEELLAFSNETLLRAVAQARTPVVSAIGHEVDTPLLDFVADWRASTPTDAGKHIVPDAAEESARLGQLRARARRAVAYRLDAERRLLVSTRTRAVMADPLALLTPHRQQVAALRSRSRERVDVRIGRESDRLVHLSAQVRALSPQSTLDRGYAVVQHTDGHVVRDSAEVAADEPLHVLVAHGGFAVRVSAEPDSQSG